MKKIKLKDANKQAIKLIEKLVSKELKLNYEGKSELTSDEINTLFLIRDGHGDKILDPWKLEEYDGCYGVDIYD